ncbi:MAG: isocitrate lyase/PEP mutase family protein [Pseudomonadota bacterium]
MADPALRQAISTGEFIAAPGVFDMMSVKIANRVGFDAVYASGYWLTASYLGLPDAGIATYTDMVNRVGQVCELAEAPVIADADTGYGALLNLHHTVKGYEKVGVSGFQFEDQVFPKQCGHVGRRQVIPMEDMVQKIAVALDARSDSNMLLIARTDARSNHGLNAAIERGHAYAEAGADIVFVEALESVDEMRKACATIDAPLLANMANGGSTPLLSRDELIDVGYSAAIFPAMSALSAMAAVEKSYQHFKTTGTTRHPDIDHFDFQDMCQMLGFGDVHAFEDRWLSEDS